MKSFECNRCDHKIPDAYRRSHDSWHVAHADQN